MSAALPVSNDPTSASRSEHARGIDRVRRNISLQCQLLDLAEHTALRLLADWFARLPIAMASKGLNVDTFQSLPPATVAPAAMKDRAGYSRAWRSGPM